MNRKEKKNMYGDLSRDQQYVRSIPKIPFRQPFIYVKGVGENELDGDHETSGNVVKMNLMETMRQVGMNNKSISLEHKV